MVEHPGPTMDSPNAPIASAASSTQYECTTVATTSSAAPERMFAVRNDRCGPSRSARVPAWGDVTAASRKRQATADPRPAAPKPRSSPISGASAPTANTRKRAAVCDEADDTSERVGRAPPLPG